MNEDRTPINRNAYETDCDNRSVDGGTYFLPFAFRYVVNRVPLHELVDHGGKEDFNAWILKTL